MSEDKKGRVKFTVEVEINEALMDMMKEGMKNMPPMMMRKWRHMGGMGGPMGEHMGPQEEPKE